METKVKNNFPKVMDFKVQGVFSAYNINVKFPEFFGEITSLGGDWGSSYKLQIDPSSTFEITIKSPFSEVENVIHNEIKEIYLKTPFLSADRKTSSYICEIPVTKDGVTLHLSFDEDLNIKAAQMIKNWKDDPHNLQTEILGKVS